MGGKRGELTDSNGKEPAERAKYLALVALEKKRGGP